MSLRQGGRQFTSKTRGKHRLKPRNSPHLLSSNNPYLSRTTINHRSSVSNQRQQRDRHLSREWTILATREPPL